MRRDAEWCGRMAAGGETDLDTAAGTFLQVGASSRGPRGSACVPSRRSAGGSAAGSGSATTCTSRRGGPTRSGTASRRKVARLSELPSTLRPTPDERPLVASLSIVDFKGLARA